MAILPPASSATSASLLAASGSKDGELRLWDLLSGTSVALASLPMGGTCCLEASLPEDMPHARVYASSTCGEIHAYKADQHVGFARVLTARESQS